MGPCIFIYEDHVSNQRDAIFYAHLLIATHSTCFGRHSPIIRSSGTVYAAYGTVMLIYVKTGSTILSMELWLMLYNIMWMFIGCGLRDLFPLVGSLSVLVTVRVYTDGPSAVVSLLCYFLVVWFVGSLCGNASGPVRFSKSGGG
jgi:hypothetical protein